MTDPQVRTWIQNNYSTFVFPTWDIDGEELCPTIGGAVDEFHKSYDLWLAGNLDKFNRMYSALNVEYNPLNNYDKNSKITHVHSGTDQTSIGVKEGTNTNKLRGFNSVSDQNTSSQTAYSNASTDSFIHGHKEVVEEVTSGNIGVTTSQQMLQSEIDLRLHIRLFEMIMRDMTSEILIL